MLPDQIHEQLQATAHSAGFDTAQLCSNLLVEWACNKNRLSGVNSRLKNATSAPPTASERETLKQLFAVCKHYYSNHCTFNEAVNLVASEFHVQIKS